MSPTYKHLHRLSLTRNHCSSSSTSLPRLHFFIDSTTTTLFSLRVFLSLRHLQIRRLTARSLALIIGFTTMNEEG